SALQRYRPTGRVAGNRGAPRQCRGVPNVGGMGAMSGAPFRFVIIDSMTVKRQLIVRNLDPKIVTALKTRAAGNGRSVEAEHREILKTALRPKGRRTSLKDWLARMPDVGVDRDFARRPSKARPVRL